MLLAAFRRPVLLIPPIVTLTLYLLFHPSSSYTRDLSSLGTSLKQYSGLGAGDTPLPKVHLFLPINKVAADRDKRFCRTIESAVVNGWEPIVYNWAMEGTRSHLLKNKVFGFAKLLNSEAVTKDMAEDDLILLIDALDVWLQLSPTVMGRRFLDYNSDIVIGADKMCWPNPADTHDCTAAPVSPLPQGLFYNKDDESDSKDVRYSDRPQHANSGTVLGRLHKMKELYVKLVDTMESERYKNFHSDQGAFNMLLGDGYLRVDPFFRLFWASAYDTTNVDFINTRYPPDPTHPKADDTTPWELYPALIHHKRTGEVPVAVHFNDYYHKEMLEDWWGRHWWSSDRKRFKGIVKDRMERGIIKFATEEGITEDSVKNICPNLAIWDAVVEPLSREVHEHNESKLRRRWTQGLWA